MGPELITSPNSRQIADALRGRIEAGEYAVGQWLPAERDLAVEFGVHRRTVRGAIIHLSREGRLVCRPRCRPLVASDSEATAPTRRPAQAVPQTELAAGRRLVALVMWHGGFELRTTAQQRIFWGFNRALAQSDYHGVFLDLGETIESEEENAAREAARLHYVLEHGFAGVVFYPYAYRSNRGLIRETARRLPLVLIDRQIPGVETDYVGIDNLAAMRDAARHLLAEGHRRIALVTQSEPINTVQDRLAGYRQAMREVREGAEETVLALDSAAAWSTFDLIFRLPDHERPSALLCTNDSIALQVAARLAAHGVRVPEDVALVGFDDLVKTLPNGVELSSIAQPFEEIGVAAARLVMERIAAPDLLARHVELPAVLMARASSPVQAVSRSFGPTLASKITA